MHIFCEKAPLIGFLPTQNIDILRNILIQKGFLCNINDYNDDTPLSIACFKNKMDFVKEMRSKPNISEINTINKKGEVPLIYWVKNKNIKVYFIFFNAKIICFRLLNNYYLMVQIQIFKIIKKEHHYIMQ